jgi:Peptidase A4 family
VRVWTWIATIVVGILAVVAVPSIVGLAGAVPTPPGLAQCPAAPAPGAQCTLPVPGDWAGYGTSGLGNAVTGHIYEINGTWIQPNETVSIPNSLNFTCPTPSSTNPLGLGFEAFGVGLDRLGADSRIIGVGSAGICLNGNAIYYAWYDFAPAAPVFIPVATITVHAGDHFDGTAFCVPTICGLQIIDTSTGQMFAIQSTTGVTPIWAECAAMNARVWGLSTVTWPLPPTVNKPHDTLFSCRVITTLGLGFPVGAGPHLPFVNHPFKFTIPPTVPSPLLPAGLGTTFSIT